MNSKYRSRIQYPDRDYPKTMRKHRSLKAAQDYVRWALKNLMPGSAAWVEQDVNGEWVKL